MNPLGKLGNKIKYLTPDEQKYVIDNIQPEGVDISKLEESIKEFKQNELTPDFINGLFDGDGSLSVSLVNPSKSSKGGRSALENVTEGDKEPLRDKISEDGVGCPARKIILVKMKFTIVQDIHNLSLLEEIKKFFNDKGSIYALKNSANCYVYTTGSKFLLYEVILPKMMGINKNLRTNKIKEVVFPLIKYYKIICTYRILEYVFVDLIKDKETLREII